MNATRYDPQSDQENTVPPKTSSGRKRSILNPTPSARAEPIKETRGVPPDPGRDEWLEKMTSALLARRHKSPWVTDDIRIEMLQRYENALDAHEDKPLGDFLRWVVEDSRYLAAEGNFQIFCVTYLAAEPHTTSAIWAWVTGDGKA
jgi:hypothetical protein